MLSGRAGSAPAARDGILPGQSRRLPSLSLRLWVSESPMTRAHVRLLGPCFKTGRVEYRPIRHGPEAPPASESDCVGAVTTHCEQCAEVERPRKTRGRGTRLCVLDRATCPRRRAVTPRRHANAPPRLPSRRAHDRRPVRRGFRTRRKCTLRAGAAARPLRETDRGARLCPVARGLNSPGRHCGSTRLPLCGFTYS